MAIFRPFDWISVSNMHYIEEDIIIVLCKDNNTWHMTYICTKKLDLTKYHISTAISNSDGGHFELQNGGYTQIIYIYIYMYINYI